MNTSATSLSVALTAAALTVAMPTIAVACPPAGEGVVLGLVTGFVGFLMALTVVTTFVVAAGSWGVERSKGFQLNRPSWWKTRIWGMGLVGWVVSFALGVATMSLVEATSLLSVLSRPVEDTLFGAMAVFFLTLPMVIQTAYVARTWHSRGWRRR